MLNGPWTDEENDLIVADYFAMLAEDMVGRPYNKAQHRHSLMPLLRSRTEGSIEFKHQNISAVLKGLGEDWIPGYKPAFNFQMNLVDAVARWLAWNPAWLGRMPGSRSANGLREAAQIWIGPSPNAAGQFCLSINVLFKLPLRQTAGMVASMLRMEGPDWAVPEFSTLCRRQKTLAVQIRYDTRRCHSAIIARGAVPIRR